MATSDNITDGELKSIENKLKVIKGGYCVACGGKLRMLRKLKFSYRSNKSYKDWSTRQTHVKCYNERRTEYYFDYLTGKPLNVITEKKQQ